MLIFQNIPCISAASTTYNEKLMNRLPVLFMLFIILSVLSVFPAKGKDLKFAVVPKYYAPYFNKSWEGCKDAASQIEGVECIYRGPEKGDVRIQDVIIEQLIKEGVDGIAVAVLKSDFLATHSIQKAIDAGIPVITFDSDFDVSTREKYKNIRLSYIGTNNFELGKAFGEQLKTLRPDGEKLIIQTGRPDSPNLNLRIMGVRTALSGKTYTIPPGEQLKNHNGWTESRTPIPNFDRTNQAIMQLKAVLNGHIKADAFIAVGGWPQNDEILYRQMMEPHKAKLDRKEKIVIISDASEPQLAMLKDNLAHANIGQSPYEMGRQAILTLNKIVKKQKYEEIIYTPLNYCTLENYDTCTKNN